MAPGRCGNCGKSSLMPGRLVGAEGSWAHYFAPGATRSFVSARVALHACVSCGFIAASVDPEELCSAIELHGSELAKQYTSCCRLGPYYDVPDLPAAHQAADGVAAIDGFLFVGNGLEAARYYRRLTEKTWDDVHEVIAKWPNLTRARKLALLGWCPKGKLDGDVNSESREHPMHDRLLDG